MTTELQTWARRYWEIGLNIIPCRDKVPAVKWKKYQKKRIKKEQIDRWFSPDSMDLNDFNGIAIITGKRNGVMVVDADSKAGIRWCDKNLPEPGFYQMTKNGKHYFYKAKKKIINGADVFGEKQTHGKHKNGKWKGKIVDVRGEAGIIILYPSPNYEIGGDVDNMAKVSFPLSQLRNGGYTPRTKQTKGERMRDAQVGVMGPKELSTRLGDISGLLVAIPPDERLSEPDWRRIGAAIHFETGGDDKGLELFRAWSSGALHGITHDNYSGTEVERYWSGFNGVEVPVRIGTIAKISRDFKTTLALDSGGDEDELRAMLKKVTTLARQAEREYAPISWCVKQFIPIGLTLMAGRPKVGKSFVCLDICNAVAEGEMVFEDMETVKGTTCYISMEDHGRRITGRLKDMGITASKNCLLLHETPKWDSGMAEFIRMLKEAHPNLSLIVVDTLIHCLPPKPGNISDYEYYYPVISGLQRLAHELQVGLVLVHHAKKGQGSSGGGSGIGTSDNIFDQILGSVAIQGAADTLMIISRRPSETEGFFITTSRDYGDMVYNVEFDETCLRWKKQDQGPVASYNENDRAIGWAIYNSIDSCLPPLQIAEDTGIVIKTVRHRLNKQGSYFEVEDGLWKIAEGRKQISAFNEQSDKYDSAKKGLGKDGKPLTYEWTKKRRNKKKKNKKEEKES